MNSFSVYYGPLLCGFSVPMKGLSLMHVGKLRIRLNSTVKYCCVLRSDVALTALSIL